MAGGCSSKPVIRVIQSLHHVNCQCTLRSRITIHKYRIVSSFETLAENLVEQNDNFTNITLQGTNLIFQGTRVSRFSYYCNSIVLLC